MTDNRNTILAVILSGLVLIAWQYFYNMPQMEKQRAARAGPERTGQAGAAGRQARPRRDHAAGRAAPSANAPAATSRPRPRPSVSRDAAIAARAARQDRHPARLPAASR